MCYLHPTNILYKVESSLTLQKCYSLHYCPVWQAWLHTFWTQQSFGQSSWHPRRPGWREPQARHLYMHTTSLGRVTTASGPGRGRQSSQSSSFSRPSGSPRAPLPGCAAGQVGTAPQRERRPRAGAGSRAAPSQPAPGGTLRAALAP